MKESGGGRNNGSKNWREKRRGRGLRAQLLGSYHHRRGKNRSSPKANPRRVGRLAKLKSVRWEIILQELSWRDEWVEWVGFHLRRRKWRRRWRRRGDVCRYESLSVVATSLSLLLDRGMEKREGTSIALRMEGLQVHPPMRSLGARPP